MNDADACHDSRTWHLAAVLPVGRERRQFQKRRARIRQQVDPLADQQLAALAVALDHVEAPARGGHGHPRAQGLDPRALRLVIPRIDL